MEWIKIKDEHTLPIAPCYAYWDDGRQTVLDCQDDCEYAIHNMKPRITHWLPVLDGPKED